MYLFPSFIFIITICSGICNFSMIINHGSWNSTHYNQTCVERSGIDEMDWALTIAPKHIENYVILNSSYDNQNYIHRFDNSDKLAVHTFAKTIQFNLPLIEDKRWEDLETIHIKPNIESLIPIDESNINLIHISLLFKDNVKVVLSTSGDVWCVNVNPNSSIVYFNKTKCMEPEKDPYVGDKLDEYYSWHHYTIYKHVQNGFTLENSYGINENQLSQFAINDIAFLSTSKAFVKLHQLNILLLRNRTTQLFSSPIMTPKEHNYSYISVYLYAKEFCKLSVSLMDYNNDSNLLGTQTFIGSNEWGLVHLNLNNIKRFNIQIFKFSSNMCLISLVDDIRFSNRNEIRSITFDSFEKEIACISLKNNNNVLIYTDPFPVLMPNKLADPHFDGKSNRLEVICLLEENCLCSSGYHGTICNRDISDVVSIIHTSTNFATIKIENIGYYNWSYINIELINDDQSISYNFSTQAHIDMYQVDNLTANIDYMLRARYCVLEGCTGFQNVPSKFKTNCLDIDKTNIDQSIGSTQISLKLKSLTIANCPINIYKIYINNKYIEALSENYNITKLLPFTTYDIEISSTGNNYNSKIDGAKVKLSITTAISAPEAPTKLRLLDKKCSEVQITWYHPNKTNGPLKNFVLSIWEMNKESSSHINLKYPVNELHKVYNFTIDQLDCSKKYMIYVQAENTFLGAHSNIISVDFDEGGDTKIFGPIEIIIVTVMFIVFIFAGLWFMIKRSKSYRSDPVNEQNPINTNGNGEVSEDHQTLIDRERSPLRNQSITTYVHNSDTIDYISDVSTISQVQHADIAIEPFRWVKVNTKTVLKDLIFGGKDIHGTELYVGRARHEEEMIPAKVSLHRNIAYISHLGKEHQTNSFEVLCKTQIDWIEAKDGEVPRNAVRGGYLSEKDEIIYIGRTRFCGKCHIGRVDPSLKCVVVSFGNQEHTSDVFEVLVGNESDMFWIEWQNLIKTKQINKAIVRGSASGSKKVYIGRACNDDDIYPATAYLTNTKAYISFADTEHIKHDFKVLCKSQNHWKSCNYGEVPSNAMKKEIDFYIGRARYDDHNIIGRIDPSNKCIYIPYFLEEISIEEYEVLVGNEQDFYWTDWDGINTKDLKNHAIIGGTDFDGNLMYIGKVKHEGVEYPAKISLIRGCAYYSFEKLERKTNVFMVLCKKTMKWIKTKDGHIPSNAIIGGKLYNEDVYIGRVIHKGHYIIGRVDPSNKYLYVPSDRKEISFTEYEVLVGDEIDFEWMDWRQIIYSDVAKHNAIIGGRYPFKDITTKIYIGKAIHDDVELPANASLAEGLAIMSINGTTFQERHFQVLCRKKFEWIQTIGKNIPNYAVRGGYCKNKDPLYIGRVKVNHITTIGKVHNFCLYVIIDGNEKIYEDKYEVLVYK